MIAIWMMGFVSNVKFADLLSENIGLSMGKSLVSLVKVGEQVEQRTEKISPHFEGN